MVMNKYKLRKFKCIGCGKIVEKRRASNKTSYCSLDCYRKSKRPQRKTGKTFKCEWCGKEIYKAKSLQLEHKFCSKDCANKWQARNKIEFICKVCGAKFKWSKSRITQANPTYCSIACRNKDKEFMINCGIQSTLVQQKKKGLNKLELRGRDILNDLGIEFNEQVLMFNKFLVDVLVNGEKVIVQWDGEYWHNKPKRKQLDKSQDAYMKKCGYRVVRITDKQIKNNIDGVYANIKRAIL